MSRGSELGPNSVWCKEPTRNTHLGSLSCNSRLPFLCLCLCLVSHLNGFCPGTKYFVSRMHKPVLVTQGKLAQLRTQLKSFRAHFTCIGRADIDRFPGTLPSYNFLLLLHWWFKSNFNKQASLLLSATIVPRQKENTLNIFSCLSTSAFLCCLCSWRGAQKRKIREALSKVGS